uniref:Uncharacterized protein n=1 Tax=Trichogramma kaykai TaxID=54128 RepID=A0ABD2VUZ4_9HYME
MRLVDQSQSHRQINVKKKVLKPIKTLEFMENYGRRPTDRRRTYHTSPQYSSVCIAEIPHGSCIIDRSIHALCSGSDGIIYMWTPPELRRARILVTKATRKIWRAAAIQRAREEATATSHKYSFRDSAALKKGLMPPLTPIQYYSHTLIILKLAAQSAAALKNAPPESTISFWHSQVENGGHERTARSDAEAMATTSNNCANP